MENNIPLLKFYHKDPANGHLGYICITNGDEKYWIDDLNEFYSTFGDVDQMRKNGVMPEEFILDTFVNHQARNCQSCYQLHLIQYLVKHSDTFLNKFGEQLEEWINTYSTERITCTVLDCADKKRWNSNNTVIYMRKTM